MSTHARYSVRRLAERALSRPDRATPEGCITALLRHLLQCPKKEVEARARELARHGRAVLPECLQAGRPCGPETRRRLSLVFWLLGPSAGAAAALVADWVPLPEAEAALLAMQEFGSTQMLDAMVATSLPYPIWLDETAVERLCRLDSPLAVRALGGFGPARHQAIPFLAHRARQGCQTARESLMSSGLPDAIDILMEVDSYRQFAPDPRFDLWCTGEEQLLQALFRLPFKEWERSANIERLHQLAQHRSEAVRLAALRILLHRPHPSWTTPLMRHCRAGVRLMALSGVYPEHWRQALRDPHPRVRQKAARLLTLEGHSEWTRLLSHPDPLIRAEAERAPRQVILAVLSQGIITRELLQAARGNFPSEVFEYLVMRLIPKAPGHKRRWLAGQLYEWKALVQLLDSPDVHTRRAGAARLLGWARRDVRPWLERESSWTVRTLLAQALCDSMSLIDPGELPGLCAHPVARVAAAAWRRRSRSSVKVEHFHQAMQRPEVTVRKAAMHCWLDAGGYLPPQYWAQADSQLRRRMANQWAQRDLLPTDAPLDWSHHELASLFIVLEGPESFALLAASRLHSPERLRMAARLGWLNRLDLLGSDPELLRAGLLSCPLALDWMARHDVKLPPDLFREILHKANELELLIQEPFLRQFPEAAELLRRARTERRSARDLLASPSPHIRCQAAAALLAEESAELLPLGLADEDVQVRWRFARVALFLGRGEVHLEQVLQHLEFHPGLVRPSLDRVLTQLWAERRSDLVTSRLTLLLAPHRQRPEVRRLLELLAESQWGAATRRLARRLCVAEDEAADDQKPAP